MQHLYDQIIILRGCTNFVSTTTYVVILRKQVAKAMMYQLSINVIVMNAMVQCQ